MYTWLTVNAGSSHDPVPAVLPSVVPPCIIGMFCCQILQNLPALKQKKGLVAAEEFESRHLDDSDAHSVATGTTEEDLRPVKVPLLPQLTVMKLAHSQR